MYPQKRPFWSLPGIQGWQKVFSQQEGRGRALLSPEIIFLNSLSNLTDFPVVPSGSMLTVQQVNRADGSQRVVTPQEPPMMLFILGLHCGCYMVLILYFPRVFIPNSPFFQVPKPQGLSATTGQHRNRDKPIIFRWKESTMQTGEGREWYWESYQSHFFPLQNLLPPNFQDLHRSKFISTSCLSSRPMLLLAWLS